MKGKERGGARVISLHNEPTIFWKPRNLPFAESSVAQIGNSKMFQNQGLCDEMKPRSVFMNVFYGPYQDIHGAGPGLSLLHDSWL